MSKSELRKDKTCLNCRHVVENRFCPNCGQENTDTRKTFHHLFIHFFEDLTHYENAFWKTIRNLYFKPASLTKEYLSGKRLSYLAPVRLYIFISFVTFFLIAVFPNKGSETGDDLVNFDEKQTIQVTDVNGQLKDSVIGAKKLKLSDVLKAEEKRQKEKNLTNAQINEDFLNFGYKNLRELDSMQKYGPADDKLSDWEYNIIKKTLIIKAENSQREIVTKFIEQIKHNFPKTLFIYMPLFAFILWLFHGKKRWYYFDHGIFTLHYFSFLLLSTLILFFVRKIFSYFDNGFMNAIFYIINIAGYLWMFYYFFPAHHRFYGETRFISFVKSIAMFLINLVLMTILLVAFMLYTFINIH